MLTYLAEITVYDASISGTRTLYYSSTGYTSAPTDSPANQHYEARLLQPALMRRDIFAQGTTGGASTTGYGLLELVNLGDLDALVDYGFDGRPFRILLGDDEAALSSFAVVLKGTMEQPEFTWSRLSIRIRDRLAELDKTCQTTLYAGNNVLPAGLEGTASDLLGKPKPKLLGKVLNIQPPCVNTSRLIYQISDGAIASVENVYDQGVALTAGAVYTSQADMEATAPSANGYRVWPAGGYIRLGSSPVGPVTVDATQGATAADRTVAQVLKSLALLSGTVVAGDILSADVTALDTANASVIGLWLGNGETIKTAMDEVVNSIGAWYGFNRLGQLRMAQLTVPSGTPVASFDYQDIVAIERTATADGDKGVPVYQVQLGYAKNYTVQTSGLAGAVTDPRLAVLAEPYLTVTATDMAVQTLHLLAPILSRNTLLTTQANAQTEATRLLTLYKSRRDRLTVKVRVIAGVTAALDLADVVQITTTRFGYAGGKLFRIIGIQADYRNGSIDMTLWG